MEVKRELLERAENTLRELLLAHKDAAGMPATSALSDKTFARLKNAQYEAEHSIMELRAALSAPEEGPSATSINLAAMILSDCGFSTDYAPLHERVAGRIAKHEEKLFATWKNSPAHEAEPVAWMTDENPPRVASTYTMGSMPRASKVSFCIPLYLHPSAPERKPMTDEPSLCDDCKVLACQVESLRSALARVMDAHEKEARLIMSYQVARENFSDSSDERKAHELAVLEACSAEREARALLLMLKPVNGITKG